MKPYTLIENDSPIILSFPHVGTHLPPELKYRLHQPFFENCPDTDWLVDKVYDFYESTKLNAIVANYSRFYVDLNRDPNQKKLYSDKRLQTSIVPTTTFSGEKLYKDGMTPSISEVNKRIQNVFTPYHQKIEDMITSLTKKYEEVLLLDAHSIKRHVPTIQQEHFPDIILGTANGSSCSKDIEQLAWDNLSTSQYNCTLNDPFQGGFITRRFGNPTEGVHALQIEMAQDIYMDESTTQLEPEKVRQASLFFKNLVSEISKKLL